MTYPHCVEVKVLSDKPQIFAEVTALLQTAVSEERDGIRTQRYDVLMEVQAQIVEPVENDRVLVTGTMRFKAPVNFCRIGDRLTLTVEPPQSPDVTPAGRQK